MIIKKATESDMPILLKFMMDLQRYEHMISNRVRADEKTKNMFKHFIRKRINNPNYVFLIAIENGKPAGIITGWKEDVSNAYKNKHIGYICQLIVNPLFQRRKIGKKLFDEISMEFKKMGLRELKIEVLFKNNKGIKFWQSCGFKNLYREMRKDI